MCFVLLCIALDVPHLFSLFRHLYVTMLTNDWISFSLSHGGIDICDGLPSSIWKWKEELFFVDVSPFTNRMQFDSLVDQDSGPAPDLSITEHDIIQGRP
ncbi:unnamed protein product [Lactuca virosa]|uniref:Uncharacterized protein n=1 Tax=Lactuca virosa TaxID=75947 RepID=A0AAU9P1D3_9ASTR|nr:unnamed protein product [Lactuca virosa]